LHGVTLLQLATPSTRVEALHDSMGGAAHAQVALAWGALVHDRNCWRILGGGGIVARSGMNADQAPVVDDSATGRNSWARTPPSTLVRSKLRARRAPSAHLVRGGAPDSAAALTSRDEAVVRTEEVTEPKRWTERYARPR